jgi:hypothetical protein
MNRRSQPAPRPRLVDRDSGQVVVERLVLAATFWQRLRGWQLRHVPPRGEGLLLVPCSAVHTFGMRFPIDVAYLDAGGTLLALHPDVAPWRIVAPCRAAQAVLEVPSGRALLQTGQRLILEGAVTTDLPAEALGLAAR